MFDVICMVVGKYGLKELTYNNRPHKIMEIVVCDNMMRQLRCSLWDQYADQILPYMADVYPGPVILILQFCRAKMFQGEPKLCNSLNITRLIVNGDGVEFQNFKDSIVDRTALSQTITTLSATYKPPLSILDELNSLVMPLKKIEHLYETKEAGSFWIYAKVVEIENENDWWYLACSRCSKKLEKSHANFYCTKCARVCTEGVTRYKVVVRVVDSTGNAPFLIFDRVGQELFGRQAIDCRDMLMSNGRNDNFLPVEFEAIIDENILFKVQVKEEQIGNYNSAFAVLRFTRDASIIDQFVSNKNEDHKESEAFSQLQNAALSCEKVESFLDDEISTPIKRKDTTETSSDNQESVKRRLLGEFSSNASSKKSRVVIKQEK
ncbi:unnamed protein product [Cuscuta epithymum]|uniref:Replication factor A C-terminal domain-containing protein n=1 Tax=Cuscuta epithymum TaxID=186058 RepID=A0AAV0CSY6_9ASTE|nr:unnamed protein product [Cuscuta epithymum]